MEQGLSEMLAAGGVRPYQQQQPQQDITSYNEKIGFNVFDAEKEEKSYAVNSAKNKIEESMKKRSTLRKAMRSGEYSTGNKEADEKATNQSLFVDGVVKILIDSGKNPEDMAKYMTSTGSADLVNQIKGFSNGMYSGDVDDFINGKNKDFTGTISKIFPDYMANNGYSIPEAPQQQITNLQDTRSGFEKFAKKATQATWKDLTFGVLESEAKPIGQLVNLGAGVINDIQKIGPGINDIITQLTETSPEKFAEQLEKGKYMVSGVAKDAQQQYESAVKNQGYQGSYEQWKQDAIEEYNNFYNNMSTQAQQVTEDRGQLWQNVIDEESGAFKTGEFGGEIAQQVLLDKWLGNVGIKALEFLGKADNKVSNEALRIATNIMNKTQGAKAKSDLARGAIEGAKAGAEFELIGDVKEGKLSDAQAYGEAMVVGAGLGALFSSPEQMSRPDIRAQNAMKEVGVDDIKGLAETAKKQAVDLDAPSALQTVTKEAVTEAKETVKKKLDAAGEELGKFRANIGGGDANIGKDFVGTINTTLTKKGAGGQIVKQPDGYYKVEGHAGDYDMILNRITETLNSRKDNVLNRQKLIRGGAKDIQQKNTLQLYEELYVDLKHIVSQEGDSQVRKGMSDAISIIEDTLMKNMPKEQQTEYRNLLDRYSKLKTQQKKIDELDNLMGKTDSPTMSDGQYMRDFLTELEEDEIISKGYKAKRATSIFLDAYYRKAISDSDKLIYPSGPGVAEEILKTSTKRIRNPLSKATGGYLRFGKDYKPTKTRKVLSKAREVASGELGADFSE